MDLDLLRTFLEVTRTRHFGKAAENLYVTQSAVSARVRQLEDILGQQLFVRLRKDIRLTSAGNRLLKHAESILNNWQRARQDVALGEDDKTLLAIGGVYSLWDILLQDWIHRLCKTLTDVAVHAEAQSEDILVRRLLDGTLDLGFMFEPPQLADLLAQEVASIDLLMVSTDPGHDAQTAVCNNYVLVDWGTSFAITHARRFPDMPPPTVRMGLGRMALAYLLECGGTAYLAEPMVREYIDTGKLHTVSDAPTIERQVFAVFAQHSERHDLVQQAMATL